MASFLVSNTGKIVEVGRKASADFLADVARRLLRRELQFIADIKSKQMSGRNGDRGVNVITGNLRRKWFNEVVPQNQHVKAMVWSTTPYAPHLEQQEGRPMAEQVQIAEHTVNEYYRRTRAQGPARSKRGKAPQAETLVKAHTVRAHFVLVRRRLQIGQAWRADFIPKMREDINAALAAHFPTR